MKNRILPIFLSIGITAIVLAFTAVSVNNDEDQWSSMRTKSIPYKVRKAEFDKGNIAMNVSFEEGEVISKNDSAITDFKLKNWTVVGDNVEWLDNTLDKNHDIRSGNRAIKIKREPIDALEINNTANGILSDFIEVIPGNYLFFFDIKLEKILPAVKRLSSKISQDIDIHLEFYDKNKQVISPGIYYNYWKKEVDNSFKGFSFSNLYYIDKFDWGRIRGRTMNYPFSEGDMPDGCKYIKIFFGLKGSGTMYVDNVDFRLSRWNFTPLERIQPFFEKEWELTDLLIPVPQEIKPKSKIDLSSKKIIVAIPENPHNAQLSSGNQLVNKINSIVKNKATLYKGVYKKRNGEIVFYIGNTNFREKLKNELKKIVGEEEGYVIKAVNDEEIVLLGNTPKGDYYAVTTVMQLLSKQGKYYHHAEIIDYPDFKGRSYLLYVFKNKWTLEQNNKLTTEEIEKTLQQNLIDIDDEVASVQKLANYKLNKIYNNYGHLSKKWWSPGKVFKNEFKRLGDKNKELGNVINLSLMINPYFHFDYESQEENLPDSLRQVFSHSKPEDLNKMKEVIKIGLDNGAKTVMICADDFVPHKGTERGIYTLFTDGDKKAFYNMAHAQTFMLGEINNWLKKDYGDIRLEFCPAPYLNEFVDYSRGSAEAFFRELASHMPKDVAVIWTGNTVRSTSYDVADIRRYTSYIEKKPMLWDNTPYARELEGGNGGYPAHYPGKAVMCNLFEPYDIIVPDNFVDIMDSHIYSNGETLKERWKIKYASFADFAWNTNSYDPDMSLFRVLISEFGKKGALKLLQFNDTYYNLVSVWATIRNGKENANDEHPYKITETQIEKGKKSIKKLKAIYKTLKKSVNNKKLLDELKIKMERKEKQFNEVIS